MKWEGRGMDCFVLRDCLIWGPCPENVLKSHTQDELPPSRKLSYTDRRSFRFLSPPHPTPLPCSLTPQPQNGWCAAVLPSSSSAPLHGQGVPSFSPLHPAPPPTFKLRNLKMAKVPYTWRKLPTRTGGTLRLLSQPYPTTCSLTTPEDKAWYV